MNPTSAFDLTPAVPILLAGLLLAICPALWVWRRERGAAPSARLRALSVLTLFITFDLVLFGAFTRLTDSGLGCPDWPGCYGSASPLGAQAEIGVAQAALPTGPVTHGKAWVEMTHRYLATGVGALITLLVLMSGIDARRQRHWAAFAWATGTLVWVCVQGAFGALTVSMKLYPAVVTLHLLLGIGLLVMLAVQAERLRPVPAPVAMSPWLYRAAWALAALCVVQIALGGWVSTNYAVLACREFPTCQGEWWPVMDFDHGFAVWRELGAGKGGGYLPFAALTAIHYTHRLIAYAVLGLLALMAWRLWASGSPALQHWALALGGVALWQLASGLSNVLLGWPLLAAVAHTGGAAALMVVLAVLLTRAVPTGQTAPARAEPRPHLRPAP